MKRKVNLKNADQKPTSRTVPVLYQNIGGEVYAFAQVGAEVYFAKVPVKRSTKKSAARVIEKEAA